MPARTKCSYHGKARGTLRASRSVRVLEGATKYLNKKEAAKKRVSTRGSQKKHPSAPFLSILPLAFNPRRFWATAIWVLAIWVLATPLLAISPTGALTHGADRFGALAHRRFTPFTFTLRRHPARRSSRWRLASFPSETKRRELHRVDLERAACPPPALSTCVGPASCSEYMGEDTALREEPRFSRAPLRPHKGGMSRNGAKKQWRGPQTLNAPRSNTRATRTAQRAQRDSGLTASSLADNVVPTQSTSRAVSRHLRAQARSGV